MERRRTSDVPTPREEEGEEEEATREERVLRDVEMRSRERERRGLVEREHEERTERVRSHVESPYASMREERSHVREERPYAFVGEERPHSHVGGTRRPAGIGEDDTPEPRERRQQPTDDRYRYPPPPPPRAGLHIPPASGVRWVPPYISDVESVNLIDHVGRKYVFPLEKCRSKEVCVILLLLRMSSPRLNAPAAGY